MYEIFNFFHNGILRRSNKHNLLTTRNNLLITKSYLSNNKNSKAPHPTIYITELKFLFTNFSCLFTFFPDISFSCGPRKSGIEHVLSRCASTDLCKYQIHLQIPCRILITTGGSHKILFFGPKLHMVLSWRHTKSSTIELTSFDQFLMSCKSFLAFQKLLEDIFAPILDAPHIDFSLS